MKTSVFHAAVMACAILLSGLFPSEQALAQGCPTPSFGPPNWFDEGAGVHSVAVGDFNGDGKPDLAILGWNGGPIVSVLLGNGDGTFQTPVSYGWGMDTDTFAYVAVDDFNSDGKPDLFVGISLTGGGAVATVLLNTCVSASPSLAISLSNATLTVSWPFPSTGFVLESATSLSPPDWQPAPELVVTNNALLEVLVPVNPGGRYFRLHKP